MRLRLKVILSSYLEGDSQSSMARTLHSRWILSSLIYFEFPPGPVVAGLLIWFRQRNIARGNKLEHTRPWWWRDTQVVLYFTVYIFCFQFFSSFRFFLFIFEHLFLVLADCPEYFPALLMLRAEWWRVAGAGRSVGMMTLSPVPWGASRDGDWPGPRSSAREIYFVFTRLCVGKYTNKATHLPATGSRHNWLKTKQCVVHQIPPNMRYLQILVTEFTTFSRRIKCPGQGLESNTK